MRPPVHIPLPAMINTGSSASRRRSESEARLTA
jgi:hypothetical protein